MKFIKTLNELLAKSLCILFFCLFCQLGQAQLVPIGNFDPNNTGTLVLDDGTADLDLADIAVSISSIQYVVPEAGSDLFDEYGPNAIAYEVWLDFDFDWGPITAIQTQEIIQFDFDILLEGFNGWYFGPNEILFCNDGETYSYTQDPNNLHSWHINVDFGVDGATMETFCGNHSLAAVAIVIEGADREYLTASYDCYDYHNEVFANVEISNAKFTMRDGRQSILAENSAVSGDDFEESYNLPSCFRDDLTTLDTYDINLMISDVNDDGIAIDLYLRSYTGAGNPPVKGDVHVFYNTDNFNPADIASDSPVNGTLSQLDFTGNYSSTVFSFDNAVGLGLDQVQIYLGTLLYAYKTDAINAAFMAHTATQVWDGNNVELTLEMSDGLELETISGSPPSNKVKLDETKNDIIISPNPAKDIIQLAIPLVLEHASLSILDIQGKQVLSERLIGEETSSTQLDVSFLQKGLYLVKLIDEERIYQSRLVID